MRHRILTLFALLGLCLPLLAQDKTPEPAPAESVRSRFWEARRVLLRGDPATAAELFRTLVRGEPGAEEADDCLYWMGRCYLRIDDREPDAVVAFLRLIRRHPESPFLDDAARELCRLGDRTIVPELVGRLEGSGAKAKMAARALAEFGEKAGLDWLAERDEAAAAPGKTAAAKEPEKKKDDDRASEIEKLRAEVASLKQELEESLALLRKLLAEKKETGAKNAGEDGR